MLHLLSRSVFLLVLFISAAAHAEDVHMDSCDGLPVIDVAVPGVKAPGVQSKMRFLVDTAATSILNSKSFSSGDPNKIAVTSWRGTVETRASAVTIAELIIGQHHLKDLRLPAVDLSAIGNTCGKRIDGILGVDLLSRLGATVNLKEHTARLARTPPPQRPRCWNCTSNSPCAKTLSTAPMSMLSVNVLILTL